MSRTSRLLTLIQALRRRRNPVSGRELAREMSVSVRTIYRDIETLIEQGAPIIGERGIGFVLRPGFLLPPLMFRDEELEALVLGASWVAAQPDQALATAAQDAVSKIMTVLPESLKDHVRYSGLLAVPGATARDVVDSRLLREAIRNERKLKLLYRDEKGQETARVVWPIAMAFFEHTRMLVAWCELRTAFRHFRTDRIASAALLQEALPRRRRLLMREWRTAREIPEASR
ncbi:MAG TPA: YafY family protein [Terriglobales bacterium]|nr:YafY family protein [Terriglobales bacterium]